MRMARTPSLTNNNAFKWEVKCISFKSTVLKKIFIKAHTAWTISNIDIIKLFVAHC